MFEYIIKRFLYAIPILIGVNILTFLLFCIINSPDDIARSHLGQKHVTQNMINIWKKDRGYDLPLFFNNDENSYRYFTETLFYKKSIQLFSLQFGDSDAGRNIVEDIKNRMIPSLSIAIPIFILGILVNILTSLLLVFFRGTLIDTIGTFLCIIIMSISIIFYIIGGQYLFSTIMKLFPISGYDEGLHSIKFIILPTILSVIAGIGSGVRWYRTIFIEEVSKEYVQTAKSKGLSNQYIYFKHILKNGLIPILTGIVVIIPGLFLGSLLLESFFSIPGLGSYTIEAIQTQDFAIVRTMVYIGTILYIIGLILTDIAYYVVDPRINFE